MDDDKSFKLNVRMFTKAAKMAEQQAFYCIENRYENAAVIWLSIAKECRWAATGEDGHFTLTRAENKES